MRSLTRATLFSALLVVTACASRSPFGAAGTSPQKVTWAGGSVSPHRRVIVDLRACTIVLERAQRMPRSGSLPTSECTALADAARTLPRAVKPTICPQPKPLLPTFLVAYADGSTIGGPRCAAGDGGQRDHDLLSAIERALNAHGPALESSGATPPGECDPIECERAAGTENAVYDFSDERCVRDATDHCAWTPR